MWGGDVNTTTTTITTFKKWVSTERCELVTLVKTMDEYFRRFESAVDQVKIAPL